MSNKCDQNDFVRTKIFHTKSKHPLVKFGAVSGGCVFTVAVLSLALLGGCDNQATKKTESEGDGFSTPSTTDMNMQASGVESISEEDIFKADDVKEYETLLSSIQKGYIDNATFDNEEMKEWVNQLAKAETSLNCKVIDADTIKPMVNDTNLFVAGVDVSGLADSMKDYFSSADEILTRLSSSLNVVKDFEVNDLEALVIGESVDVPVVVKPEGVTGVFKYKSADSSIIEVNDKGVMTGVSTGSTLITVISDNGITRTKKFTVIPYNSSGSAISREESSNTNTGGTSSKPSGSGNSGSTSSSSSSSKPSGNGGSGSSSSKPSGGNNSSSSKPSSGSSSSTPSHSHSYSSKTVKATCTSGGYTIYTCSCGASYNDNYTDATGHRWSDWKTVKKATTSSEGRKQRTCSSCGKTESKTIAKIKSPSGGSSSSGGHKITGARKAVYSYRGMDSFSSVNLVDLINAERAKEGLGKLEWTADVLTRLVRDDPDIADAYSDYFDSNGNFNPYIDPEVREPLEGAQKMANMGYATHGNGVGCHCVGASEGASTIEEALRRQIKAYMNSPEHRAILMNAGSHRVTAAYAIDSNGTVYTAILVGG